MKYFKNFTFTLLILTLDLPIMPLGEDAPTVHDYITGGKNALMNEHASILHRLKFWNKNAAQEYHAANAARVSLDKQHQDRGKYIEMDQKGNSVQKWWYNHEINDAKPYTTQYNDLQELIKNDNISDITDLQSTLLTAQQIQNLTPKQIKILIEKGFYHFHNSNKFEVFIDKVEDLEPQDFTGINKDSLKKLMTAINYHVDKITIWTWGLNYAYVIKFIKNQAKTIFKNYLQSIDNLDQLPIRTIILDDLYKDKEIAEKIKSLASPYDILIAVVSAHDPHHGSHPITNTDLELAYDALAQNIPELTKLKPLFNRIIYNQDLNIILPKVNIEDIAELLVSLQKEKNKQKDQYKQHRYQNYIDTIQKVLNEKFFSDTNKSIKEHKPFQIPPFKVLKLISNLNIYPPSFLKNIQNQVEETEKKFTEDERLKFSKDFATIKENIDNAIKISQQNIDKNFRENNINLNDIQYVSEETLNKLSLDSLQKLQKEFTQEQQTIPTNLEKAIEAKKQTQQT